jgi:hypothetical protein
MTVNCVPQNQTSGGRGRAVRNRAANSYQASQVRNCCLQCAATYRNFEQPREASIYAEYCILYWLNLESFFMHLPISDQPQLPREGLLIVLLRFPRMSYFVDTEFKEIFITVTTIINIFYLFRVKKIRPKGGGDRSLRPPPLNLPLSKRFSNSMLFLHYFPLIYGVMTVNLGPLPLFYALPNVHNFLKKIVLRELYREHTL